MNVFVTGANGFLGRRVVRAAVLAGHEVTALVRPGSAPAAELVDTGHVEIVRGDLRSAGPWCEPASSADAVAHLASATSGDLAAHVASTVRGTEQLLAAIDPLRLDRFVQISSFAVYDLDALDVGSTIDERTPLETDPRSRDAYTATKLFQEQLVREAFGARPEGLVVLRPGIIYGPGHDWAWGTALRVAAQLAIVIAPHATMRLTFVDNCADAVVAALDAPRAGGRTIDVVDDDLPTHVEFLRHGRRAGATVGWGLPVPWRVAAAVGRLVGTIDRRWFDGRARLPELLASARLAARWQPLQYDNRLAHDLLGWTPRVGLAEGVRLTVAGAPR